MKSLGSVVELVDAPHSKCGTFGYVGSSPTAPTLMNTYTRFDISFMKGNCCWLWYEKGKKYLDADIKDNTSESLVNFSVDFNPLFR